MSNWSVMEHGRTIVTTVLRLMLPQQLVEEQRRVVSQSDAQLSSELVAQALEMVLPLREDLDVVRLHLAVELDRVALDSGAQLLVWSPVDHPTLRIVDSERPRLVLPPTIRNGRGFRNMSGVVRGLDHVDRHL